MGGRGGDCRPPPHPGGGAGPRGVGSSCSRPRHPLGLGSGARVSGARRAAATRHRVEQRRPRRTQSCQSKRRHAGQRHGAHGGSDLLGPRPAPSLQEPGEEGALRAARGCESAWGGRGPGRLRGTARRNPSPASPRWEGPGKKPAARGRGATAGIGGYPALFHDGVSRLSSPPESARCLLPPPSPGVGGTPWVWLPAQPPAGLRIAVASPVSQPSAQHRAPGTRCLDQKSILARTAPELGAVQRGVPSPRFAP